MLILLLRASFAFWLRVLILLLRTGLDLSVMFEPPRQAQSTARGVASNSF
jgi:hypothetical protein